MPKCKDCIHNGDCEIQLAPPPSEMTWEERENANACELFVRKEE